MTLIPTLVLMIASMAVFALAVWKTGQPSNPLKPRMIPWMFVVLLSGVLFLTVLAHMFYLFGIDPPNRFGPD